MKIISKVVEGLDQIQENVLIGINLFMAGFVLLAHGGYLALTLIEDGEVPFMIMISIPLSLILIVTGIAGFLLEEWKQKILSTHALILTLGSIFTFYYGLSLLINGLPDGNFSWDVGLFTFFCVYPVYLARRTLLKYHVSKTVFLKYIHIILLIIALIIDISVFAKAAAHFENYQREFFEKHPHSRSVENEKLH